MTEDTEDHQNEGWVLVSSKQALMGAGGEGGHVMTEPYIKVNIEQHLTANLSAAIKILVSL